MNRREFVKQSCLACLSVTALSGLIGSCTPTRFASGQLEKDGLKILKSDFEISQKGGKAFSSFIIVRNDALKYPICVYRFSDQEYTALWMMCTHQGAELQVAGDVLQCPAHGSEFSNRGEVNNGPASISLRTFPVRVSDKEIFIDLRKQS